MTLTGAGLLLLAFIVVFYAWRYHRRRRRAEASSRASVVASPQLEPGNSRVRRAQRDGTVMFVVPQPPVTRGRPSAANEGTKAAETSREASASAEEPDHPALAARGSFWNSMLSAPQMPRRPPSPAASAVFRQPGIFPSTGRPRGQMDNRGGRGGTTAWSNEAAPNPFNNNLRQESPGFDRVGVEVL